KEPPGNSDSSRASVVTDAHNIVRAHFGTPHHRFTSVLLGLSARRLNEASAIAISEDPRVDYVEENSIFHASSTETPVPYSLERIDVRPLPQHYNQTYDYNVTGSISYTTCPGSFGVHIYVVDSGINGNSVEFAGRIGDGVNACTHEDATIQCHNGAPFYCNELNDCRNHGTGVAGVAAGSVYGVAKGAIIHSVRVLGNTGLGSSDDVCNGLEWVALHHCAPAVANLSLDAGYSDTAVDTCVRNLFYADVPVIVSAGNDIKDACTTTPGEVSEAITVGATDALDVKRSTSNYGSCVDVFAPGDSIVAASAIDNTGTSIWNGTSFAAAYVTGVAALYLSQVGFVPASTVLDFLVLNATTPSNTPGFAIGMLGSGSPNRMLYSRWNSHWYLIGVEDCYADFGTSCYSRSWRPACPARPVKLATC